MSNAIVIPARRASSRLPNKMLLKVDGQETLIQRVFRLCQEANLADVFVATDCEDIAALFDEANVIMTPSEARNGTERISYALKDYKLRSYQKIVNVQGDMIDPPMDAVKQVFDNMFVNTKVVTVVTEMPSNMQDDPNTVKCIRTNEYSGWGSQALWFGRGITGYGDWHLGIYGYNRYWLGQYKNLPVPIEEEKESLEQLRWIKNGIDIAIIHTDEKCGEINTREDLDKWQQTTLR